MVDRTEVVYAYRFLLGREPENEAVIEERLALKDWRALRDIFLNSDEVQQNLRAFCDHRITREFQLAEPNQVDVESSEQHFAELFDHVLRNWEVLGAARPYWSVIVHPDFLPEVVAKNLGDFYASGLTSWSLFERAAARAGRFPSSDWTAFELGCGVGRVTMLLAKRFEHVLAYDVSRPHLDIARAYLADAGVENVTLTRLDGLQSLLDMRPFDLFYSVLVLQHNPPPLMYQLLTIICKKLRPNGLAYLQIPVAGESYKFSIDEYMRQMGSGMEGMEMHVLPQKYLFSLLQDNALRIIDIQIERIGPPELQSMNILAEKTVE
jgi:SAM-dependent methyltransferase